jgi:hypothetical protein
MHDTTSCSTGAYQWASIVAVGSPLRQGLEQAQYDRINPIATLLLAKFSPLHCHSVSSEIIGSCRGKQPRRREMLQVAADLLLQCSMSSIDRPHPHDHDRYKVNGFSDPQPQRSAEHVRICITKSLAGWKVTPLLPLLVVSSDPQVVGADWIRRPVQ